jgi:hypothetical protein
MTCPTGVRRVTCEIIDARGKLISKHTSTGGYVIASCDSGGTPPADG